MEKSRGGDIFNIDFNRRSFAKHFRRKKQLENEKQGEMVIPQWLFEEPIENKTKKI